MANRCEIEISIPLADIPDKTERQEFWALHKAEQKWKKKTLDTPFYAREHDEFLASQPGVPLSPTEYCGWSCPSISAAFGDRNGIEWAYPYKFKRGDGLTYQLGRGQIAFVEMDWSFKWSFPWWAQVGFAGSEKIFGKYETNDLEDRGWLAWESEVSKILENLKFVIGGYEELPISGQAWEWHSIYSDLYELKQIYIWFQKVNLMSSSAIATLDWSEVATNMMDYETIKSSNGPNQIMAGIIEMAMHTAQRNSGKLSLEKFRGIYADKASDYVSITKRGPFDSERMI